MGRILGNPFGEIRGKVGGTVFSRNRAGQFMRLYVHPAQANSIAQLNARASFGTASQTYSGIGGLDKQSWANFAIATYNPLTKTNTGQFTGQQAFIGINQSAQMSESKVLAGDWAYTPGGTALAKTDIHYQAPATAPTVSIKPTVKQDPSGLPMPLGVVCTSLNAYGNIKLQINFGITGAGILAGDMVDGNGNYFGIGVYCSDVVNFLDAKPKNKWMRFLGNTVVPNFTANLTAGTTNLYYESGTDTFADFKSFPILGDYVLLTFVSIGVDGTQATIASSYKQINA